MTKHKIAHLQRIVEYQGEIIFIILSLLLPQNRPLQRMETEIELTNFYAFFLMIT